MASLQYNNAVLTSSRTATPDPYVTFSGGMFYMTFTAGDHIEVWSAQSLPDFSNPTKLIVYRPPAHSPYSQGLWAPEIHSSEGRWYIYFAAADPKHGNKSHRMYILGGPSSHESPMTDQWQFLGPIQGMDQKQWAIDGTVIHSNWVMYFVYSGWPEGEMNNENTQQLWISRLKDPVTADSKPVCISKPEHAWERTEPHGINEGPQYLESPDGSWKGLGYSCAGSWTNQYKMATLQFLGGDPLDKRSWRKSQSPSVKSAQHGKGPWGPGHGSFSQVGNEVSAVYHATDGPGDGWGNRKARVQRVVFNPQGPWMGECVGEVTGDYQKFVGDSAGGDGGGDARHGLRAWLHQKLHGQ